MWPDRRRFARHVPLNEQMPPRLLHYSDVENAYDTPDRVARLATVVADSRGDDALVAGSGDNTGPGVLSLVTEGRQSLDFFETVDPHVETVGNHDFDHGTDALTDLVADAPQQWVLANVTVDGDRFGAAAGIRTRTTVDIDGATVGVVGVLDPATPTMTPGTDHLDFEDPVAAVARECEAFRATAGDPVDYVVALAHTTDEDARRIASETAVDAVLAGHSHERTATTIEGTPLTRPGATGAVVFELDLASGAVTEHETAEADPEPTLVAALETRLDAAGLDEVVGHVDDPLSRERPVRLAGEWRLGNFVADAYRWKTGADIGLQNGGGIREGPPLSGDVTAADLVSCSPFDEPVVVAAVSGAELTAVAHEADGRLVDSLPDYWWGHVSGMRIDERDPSPDDTREADRDGRARVDGGEATATSTAGGGPAVYDVTVDGEPVDPGGSYTVAMPAYLLKTGREFPTLDRDHLVAETDVQYEVIVDYARAHGIEAALEGRVPTRGGGVRQ
jgi:2',3'-cyclic-nucleotide 2'-phosphodiesterase (5'-nucleotidase family)